MKILENLVRLILIEGKGMPYSISGPAMEKGLMLGKPKNNC